MKRGYKTVRREISWIKWMFFFKKTKNECLRFKKISSNGFDSGPSMYSRELFTCKKQDISQACPSGLIQLLHDCSCYTEDRHIHVYTKLPLGEPTWPALGHHGIPKALCYQWPDPLPSPAFSGALLGKCHHSPSSSSQGPGTQFLLSHS